MNLNQDFNTSTNDKLFWQIFMQFPQTWAIVPAPYAPNIKSEYKPILEVLNGKRTSIEQIHECLEIFRINLNLKLTLNLDHIPTPEACIVYMFSCTFRTAQVYITPKI